MRKQVIAGNWKMNKTLSEATKFVDAVAPQTPSAELVESIVCAPFPYLTTLVERAGGSDVKIAAQTMHYEDNGAFTGEVAPPMLQEIGVSHVIVGHSERRAYYNETDETVNKKVHAAFAHQLIPIICVGETLDEREANQTSERVEEQVNQALAGLSNDQVEHVIIAYEPIWAIGTGKSATSKEANDVCMHIRHVVQAMTTDVVANNMRIQYGGSVKPANIDELMKCSDIDGALVGGASLEEDSFLQLVEAGKNE